MWFGIGLFVFLALLIVGMAGNIRYFIDPFGFVMVLLPSVMFGMAIATPGGFLRAMALPFRRTAELAEAAQAMVVWGVFGQLCMAMGILGFLVGAVLLLQNASQPSELGPALGVAALTMFYGALLQLISLAARRLLQRISEG